jgi:hypothetical protein
MTWLLFQYSKAIGQDLVATVSGSGVFPTSTTGSLRQQYASQAHCPSYANGREGLIKN